MQKTTLTVVFAISVLLPQLVQAQGVLYVSNLGQAATASSIVASNSWIAQTFVTGNSPGGYLLAAIQLDMDAASGTPGGFAVSIYSKTGNPQSLSTPGDVPNSNLGNLVGPDPVTQGIFTYTNSGILLSPSTFYFVVVTAVTPPSLGGYGWHLCGSLAQSNGFSIDDSFFNSDDQSNWIVHLRQGSFKLGIYASAVPPPNLIIVPNEPGGVSILWSNVGSYTLQQNINLAATNWTSSTYTITNNVLMNFCTVTSTAGSLFFRLKQ